MSFFSDIKLKYIFKLFFKILLVFFIISISSVLLYRFVPVAYTPLMAWKSTLNLFDNGPISIEKKWVPVEQIAKSMQQAVIKAEDAKFYIHNGFDYEAIEKAIKFNKTHKKQKGASTISQQTAKNVFLWPSRSWLRKGMEVYFTVLIETLWSKKRILEVYLNVIELGPNVYGVEAASQKYFHKKAKNLSSSESALIASVLPNPIKFKINKPSAYILKRQRKIMGRGVAQPLLGASNIPKVISTESSTEESKEFYDIKFDNEDEGDNGAESSNSAPN
ncbi:MAG: monofunctional biosynthetic peptidoglycan transglycosylase [Bacteriovorax sp.]|nr:monofunctional biosynthetic peptidoglycan transglycosylase [Bacteriovorax sp.]